MAKGKDFYGNAVTAVIKDACREFGVSQEELDIEVLETGSAGIFGLCKKKAHIRAQLKKNASQAKEASGSGEQVKEKKQASKKKEQSKPVPKKEDVKKAPEEKREPVPVVEAVQEKETNRQPAENKEPAEKKVAAEEKVAAGEKKKQEPAPVAPPSEEILAQINGEISRMLELMGYPSQVALKVEGSTLNCHLTGEYEEVLTGSDGRTLDSMQYLLRKMISRRLPDRMMLALDAGDFRERRAEELKERARQLAEEVKETGKTQAIPALNPAERREVHMVLQEDKAIRSRSVGEGLFKKVLIYKPGKGSKPSSRKGRGRQGGRSSKN